MYYVIVEILNEHYSISYFTLTLNIDKFCKKIFIIDVK